MVKFANPRKGCTYMFIEKISSQEISTSDRGGEDSTASAEIVAACRVTPLEPAQLLFSVLGKHQSQQTR